MLSSQRGQLSLFHSRIFIEGFYYEGELEGEDPDPNIGVLGYLNSSGSSAGLGIIPDVIVSIAIPTLAQGGYGDAFLTVYICDQASYKSNVVFVRAGAGDRAEGLYAGGGALIHSVRDMNANGVSDIVFSVPSLGELYVVEWNGDHFGVLIKNFDEDLLLDFSYINIYNGNFVVRNTDGNDGSEILITYRLVPRDERTANCGPEGNRTETWAWEGYHFTLSGIQYSAPQYRFQAVQDGDDASLFGEYEEALAFYQQAIFDDALLGWAKGQLWPDSIYAGQPTPMPDPSERARLSAYARYRILLLHILQGNELEAATVYEGIQDRFPEGADGYAYAELAKEFWEEYQSSGILSDACNRAKANASEHAAEVLMPLRPGFYGWANRSYSAEDLCPFN